MRARRAHGFGFVHHADDLLRLALRFADRLTDGRLRVRAADIEYDMEAQRAETLLDSSPLEVGQVNIKRRVPATTSFAWSFACGPASMSNPAGAFVALTRAAARRLRPQQVLHGARVPPVLLRFR